MQSSKGSEADPRLIAQHFAPLVDPRVVNRTDHPLLTVIVMGLAAVIAGCTGWEEMESFAQDHREWFATFLAMPNGVPSDSTFYRVFRALRPAAFEACMRAWVQSLQASLAGEVVAFDGKTVRGAAARALPDAKLHLVHVWACKQRLLLAHKPVEGAAYEGEAMRELIQLVDVRGAILSGDAGNCSHANAEAILEAEADYLLHLKANVKKDHDAAMAFFEAARANDFEGVPVRHRREAETGHGRIEVREAWSVPASACPLPGTPWPSLRSLTWIERTRVVGFEVSRDVHVYLASLPPRVQRILTSAREHWGVENGLHWVLDVQMGEDACAIHDANAAANVAALQRIALILLRRDDTYRSGKRVKGVAAKQRKANRDTAYLQHLFSLGVP